MASTNCSGRLGGSGSSLAAQALLQPGPLIGRREKGLPTWLQAYGSLLYWEGDQSSAKQGLQLAAQGVGDVGPLTSS